MDPRTPEQLDAHLLSLMTVTRQVAPPTAPWECSLVSDSVHGPTLLVEATQIGWAWDQSPTGHIAAPLDLLTRPDGISAIMPRCAQRVDDFLATRAESDTPLSPGEVVTLSVSLLRGVDEAHLPPREGTTAPERAGRWWLTDAGRPVLVAGEDILVATSTTANLGDILTQVSDSRLAEAIRDAIETVQVGEKLSLRLAELEAAFFAAAEPETLATIGTRRTRTRIRARADDSPAGARRAPRMLSRLTHYIAMVSPEASNIAARMLSVLTRPPVENVRHTDRRMIALGITGLGAAVAAVVLAWPQAPTPSGDGAVAITTSASGVPVEETAGNPPANVELSSDSRSNPDVKNDAPLTAAELLVADFAQCRTGDATLCESLYEQPTEALALAVAGLPPSDAEVRLLDDYGGAASIGMRPAGEQEDSHILVIVLQNDTWLLRDVFSREKTSAQEP